MFRGFVHKNINLVSIAIFIAVFTLLFFQKPAFLYNSDGSLRQFGIGYANKTIMPLWLLSIILGILIYTGVLYYITYPKIVF